MINLPFRIYPQLETDILKSLIVFEQQIFLDKTTPTDSQDSFPMLPLIVRVSDLELEMN